MEIHGLAFGVVAFLGHTATARTEFIIGIDGTITGDQLYGFTRTQQALQTEELIKQSGVNGFHFIGPKITEKVVKFC